MNDDSPVFTAAAYLQAMNIGTRLSDDVVLVFDQALVEVPSIGRRMANRLFPGDARRHPFRALSALANGADLVVASPGAAVAGATLELVAAMGGRSVVAVGAVAALTELDTGTRVVVERSVTHDPPLDYPSTRDTATDSLTQQLALSLGAPALTTYSTGVPFRQTPSTLRGARESAQVLEMECAALFQVADVLGLSIGSVGVVSDHYDGTMWRPGDPGVVRDGLRCALDGVTEFLGATR